MQPQPEARPELEDDEDVARVRVAVEEGAPFADDEAISKLDARSVELLRRMVWFVVWLGGTARESKREQRGSGYRAASVEVEHVEPIVAFPDVIAAANDLGFRYVGKKREGLTPIGIETDVWISPDESTYLLGRQAQTLDPGVRIISRYYLLSYFDDGTCIETVGLERTLFESSAELRVRAGHDKLPIDWERHRDAVRLHCKKEGCCVIRVTDHARVLELTRLYFRHILPASPCRSILAMAMFWPTIALFTVATILYLLR